MKKQNPNKKTVNLITKKAKSFQSKIQILVLAEIPNYDFDKGDKR